MTKEFQSSLWLSAITLIRVLAHGQIVYRTIDKSTFPNTYYYGPNIKVGTTEIEIKKETVQDSTNIYTIQAFP